MLPAEAARAAQARREEEADGEEYDEEYDDEDYDEEEEKEDEDEEKMTTEEYEKMMKDYQEEQIKKYGDPGEGYEWNSDYDSEGNYIWGEEGVDWEFYYEEDR